MAITKLIQSLFLAMKGSGQLLSIFKVGIFDL